MAKSPEQMIESMVENLREKTGRTLSEWVAIARAAGLGKHGEIVKHLKEKQALTHGYANLVAQRALQSDDVASPGGDDLVEAQYAGAKAPLRPLYDAVLKIVMGFGSDIEVSPKKVYVSLRRKKQFAIIQPSTATRLDVGLSLKGVAPSGRLEPSGSFNAMVTHRVRISGPKEVDAQLANWLKKAYEGS